MEISIIHIINECLQTCFDNSETFINADKTSDIDKKIREIITSSIPKLLKNYLNIPEYITSGSVGKGRATKSPWIAILDSDITNTTQDGVYIVFIFSSDYKHIYLTINQGTTAPEAFGVRLGKKEIVKRREEVRTLLNMHHPNLRTEGEVDVVDVRYRKGVIYYSEWNVKDDVKCQSLLDLYVDVYRQYKEKIKQHVVERKQNFYIAPKYIPYSAALRTKPFMLLAGISGTGKSRIVREMAKACWKEGDPEYGKNHPRNFCMVQVKPNWHDSTELIGYVTRISGTPEYIPGPFLRFLAAAIKDPEVPYFLCLDEMNLAPVEQYFAEYLSVIESRKLNPDGTITTDPIIEYENTDAYGSLIDQLFDTPEERKAYKTDEGGKRLTIPRNLFVVGTVNMDETTFSFSRKVLDRAMTIEMNEVDLHGGLDRGIGNEIGYIGNSIIGDAAEGCDIYEDNRDLCDQVLAYLVKVNAILEGTPFKIAYRTRNEFLMYAVNRKKLDEKSQLWQSLDEMTSMKILSRIEGDEERTKKVLESLNALVKEQIVDKIGENADGTSALPESISAAKIDEMLAKLKATGFTSYWA